MVKQSKQLPSGYMPSGHTSVSCLKAPAGSFVLGEAIYLFQVHSRKGEILSQCDSGDPHTMLSIVHSCASALILPLPRSTAAHQDRFGQMVQSPLTSEFEFHCFQKLVIVPPDGPASHFGGVLFFHELDPMLSFPPLFFSPQKVLSILQGNTAFLSPNSHLCTLYVPGFL